MRGSRVAVLLLVTLINEINESFTVNINSGWPGDTSNQYPCPSAFRFRGPASKKLNPLLLFNPFSLQGLKSDGQKYDKATIVHLRILDARSRTIVSRGS